MLAAGYIQSTLCRGLANVSIVQYFYTLYFFLCFIQFFDILMVTGFRFVQCDDNRWYRIYNYAYLDYLPSPLASWSWVEA